MCLMAGSSGAAAAPAAAPPAVLPDAVVPDAVRGDKSGVKGPHLPQHKRIVQQECTSQ